MTPSHITQTDHDLRKDTFRAFDHKLAVVKLHTHWSEQNAVVLRQEGIRYCIQYRDLRDTAVSWYFYVRDVNPNHYLHDIVSKMSIDEGLDYYVDNILASEVNWIRDWRQNRGPNCSKEISYESLRHDPFAVFSEVCRFSCGDLPDSLIRQIVEKHSFRRVTGRSPGVEDRSSFARKGIVGDWKNYLKPSHIRRFKELAGDLLVELGYEQGYDWRLARGMG